MLKCFKGLLNARAFSVSDNLRLRLALPGTQADAVAELPGRSQNLPQASTAEEGVRAAEGRSETGSYCLPSYHPKLVLQVKVGSSSTFIMELCPGLGAALGPPQNRVWVSTRGTRSLSFPVIIVPRRRAGHNEQSLTACLIL